MFLRLVKLFSLHVCLWHARPSPSWLCVGRWVGGSLCLVFAIYVSVCAWIDHSWHTKLWLCVCCIYPGSKCMCVQTPRVCFSVSSLDVCSTSVHVCEWVRCAQSNYVIRAEPSGHLCGRALQLAKDSLLDFVSLLLCVCVYNWTPYGWELPFPCISLCIALMQHLLQLEETQCDWRKLYIKVVFIQINTFM